MAAKGGILLADDNPTMQRVVELTFAEQGLPVVCVSDGQAAVDYIAAERPAVALISVTLPKLDGFEIARMVRDRPDLQGVRVLLVAGAFDIMDAAQLRDSGAAGVLIKPFEPGLLIKRVKELLGMSKPDVRPLPVRPAASPSGRLITSVDGPVRASVPTPAASDPAPRLPAAPPAAVPPAEGRHSGAEPLGAADTPPRASSETAWDELREASGLGESATVETSDSGDDYFGKLDAVFDSLDAQLAGRPAPAGPPTNAPPAPRIPAAMDPERRPAPPPHVGAGPHERPQPVFEIDEDWFGKNAASSVRHEEMTDFGEFEPGAPGPQSAPGALGTDDWRALSDPTPAARVDDTPGEPQEEVTSFEPRNALAPAPPDDRSQVAQPDSPLMREPTGATYGEISFPSPAAPISPAAPAAPAPPAAPVPPPPGFDAFATLWAHEQGEPLPPTPPSPPTELSEQSVEAVADCLTDRLASRVSDDVVARVTEGLAARVTGDLAIRVTDGLASRVTEDLATRLTEGLASRVTEGLAGRVTEDLAARLADSLGTRLAADLSARMTDAFAVQVEGLAPRLAEGMATRVAEGLAPRVTEDLARRVSQDLAQHLGDPIAEQLTSTLADRLIGGIADRVSASLPGPVSAGIAERIGSGLGDRLSDELTARIAARLSEDLGADLAARLAGGLAAPVASGLATRVTEALGERVSSGLAEQIAARLAERVMQNAFGESLRQTVHEVSERLVREEIARIRAAVGGS